MNAVFDYKMRSSFRFHVQVICKDQIGELNMGGV
jgi:hypothetical protein